MLISLYFSEFYILWNERIENRYLYLPFSLFFFFLTWSLFYCRDYNDMVVLSFLVVPGNLPHMYSPVNLSPYQQDFPFFCTQASVRGEFLTKPVLNRMGIFSLFLVIPLEESAGLVRGLE